MNRRKEREEQRQKELAITSLCLQMADNRERSPLSEEFTLYIAGRPPHVDTDAHYVAGATALPKFAGSRHQEAMLIILLRLVRPF